MKLSRDEMLSEKVICKKPYEREGSYLFFKCVKNNDLEKFDAFVKRCRYHLFDKDDHYRTCLHIVAMRGHGEMCRRILLNGCSVDEGDMLERTALFYAASKGHLEIASWLLKAKASPFLK
jgi:ankyrin repeat protein